MSSLQVKVAFLAAVVMLLSLPFAYAQEEVGQGVVLEDSRPVDQPGGEVTGEPREVPQPPPAPPEPSVIQGQDGQDGIDGQDGLPGREGHDGRDGQNGQDGKTIVRKGHQDHEKVYQEVKDWNPASCSRLDAKLDRNSAEDQAFARGLVEGGQLHGEKSPKEKAPEATPPAPTTTVAPAPHHGEFQFPWWLLILLAILGTVWLWYRYWRHPTIVNTATFYANRRLIGERQARVRVVPGCRQDCSKQIRNVSAGELNWRRRTEANPGDVMEYQLRTRNDAHTPIHASGVWVLEDLPEGLVFLPGSGRAYIGHRWERTADGGWGADRSIPIPDWALDQLLAGSALRMNQIPGLPVQLPGRNSLYIVFRAEVDSTTDAGDVDVEFVVPPGQPEPAQPAQHEEVVEPAETPKQRADRIRAAALRGGQI